jgi:abhydrolase domain-containing protein 17
MATKKRWHILSYVLIAYGLLTCVLYFVSDYFIFPVSSSSYKDARLGQIIKKLTTKDGKTITAVYLPNPKAYFTLLISQGNNTDLGAILPGLMAFHQQGFSIFAYDYHGYGTSEGVPSEKNTYKDIEAAYEYLIHHLNIPPSQIIIHGRSVGTGPSIELATHKPCGGVIIESSFLSAFRVYTHVPLFPIDKFANYRKIKKIRAPLLFIHGTEDEVIPLWHAEQLYQSANPPKEFFWVKGGLHNFHANMPEKTRKAYFEAITKFINGLRS